MIYRYQYQSQDDRDILLKNNSSLILIEEQNIIEGNFLIFSDTTLEKDTIYTQVPQDDYESVKEQQSQMSSDFQGLTDILAEKGLI